MENNLLKDISINLSLKNKTGLTSHFNVLKQPYTYLFNVFLNYGLLTKKQQQQNKKIKYLLNCNNKKDIFITVPKCFSDNQTVFLFLDSFNAVI